jgi:hypothetical protein
VPYPLNQSATGIARHDIGHHVAIQAINIDICFLTLGHCQSSRRRSHISLVTVTGRSGGGQFAMIGTALPFKPSSNAAKQNLTRHGHGKVVIAALRSQPCINAATVRSRFAYV